MRGILQTLKNINLNCLGAARLINEHSERRLTLSERMGLWLHLLICRSCRGYEGSVRFLRRMMRAAGKTASLSADAVLSPEARERIRRMLQDR